MAVEIHLIANAHLDPVWLWDWREGLNEGISTCRAIADLLDEFPEATFIRGEAAIYEFVERHDPELFNRIVRFVAEGRWDVVGGTYIQADHNLPSTETLVRQYVRGKEYFRRTFGVEVTAAWAADCFGHSAGLPDILAAAGMHSFAFTRPQPGVLKIAKPAFWWRGQGGARILAYRPGAGWYGTERDEMPRRLDAVLKGIAGMRVGACFYGLGNHGGGPSRRHIREIRKWAAEHPEVRVVHSGLHGFFAALRAELKDRGEEVIPEVRGELNFCLRGCSASQARFKFAYRKAQASLLSAERTSAMIGAATGREPAALGEAWDSLLFNSFHDILPGSSIERAMAEQMALNGAVLSSAQRAQHDALMHLAAEIDTRPVGWVLEEDQPQPVPVLVWNPHAHAVKAQVEIEASLDHRPLFNYQGPEDELPIELKDAGGRTLSFQEIRVEHNSFAGLAWRKRIVSTLEVPAFGWRVVHLGLGSGKARRARSGPSEFRAGADQVANRFIEVRARKGGQSVKFRQKGKPWLPDGLHVRLYDDPWGSWGGIQEEPESFVLANERERWSISDVMVIESGPERGALWVRFKGRRSRMDLTFLLGRGRRHVEVRARVFLDERGARLKLVLPCGGDALFEAPGGVAARKPCGEAPGGRWVVAGRGAARVGFASDALYGFDSTNAEFRATIARPGLYARDAKLKPGEQKWQPVSDTGELQFRFLLTSEIGRLEALAGELEEPLAVTPVPARAGRREASGSLCNGLAPQIKLLALRWLGRNRVELRMQNTGSAALPVVVNWLGEKLELGVAPVRTIVTWVIERCGEGWKATPGS